MTDKDVTPQEDFIPVIEDDGEPTSEEVETEIEGEDTPTKNASEVSDSPKGKAESDGKRSSQIINQLGEDKKAIVGSLIQLAKDNPQAREKLAEMVSNDVSLSTYIRKKFGNDYDQLIKSKAVENENVDLDSIREQERAKARAEVLLEQLEANRVKLVDNTAASYGFNSEEVSEFRHNVDLLSSAGEDMDKAIEKAAILTNSTKALAGRRTSIIPKSGNEAPAPTKREVKISSGLASVATRYGGLKGMAKVVDGVRGKSVPDQEGRRSINNSVMVLPDLDA